ncbi:aldose epimerase family protein [Robinsoniella peoriensis]|uniref:aldose epimerase family protein n=1 Tax=Robinsoniella peoriensis TaxID=180332 RepID=UPI003624F7C3
MGMKTSLFGKTGNGQEAKIVTIMNKKGMGIEVTNYGATLVSATVPDEKGHIEDVILGYEDVTDYAANGGFFGAVIGRNGNRIGKAKVTINGVDYQMEQNENGNSLHSGTRGFDKVIWDMELLEEEATVKFTHHSPDGDEGLPGNFDVTVSYTLTDENEIRIHYTGVSDADTIANMTNHSYFNLAGHDKGTILDHTLWMDADAFTVIDEESIPTGELRSVEGTPMDFRKTRRIGDDIDDTYEQIQLAHGYDHNFVLNQNGEEKLRKIAKVTDPLTKRTMEVYTDCVGVQFYTGNFIEKTQIGKGGIAYQKRSGLCLETQFFPDAPNHEHFPSSILKAREVYDTTTIYKFV